MKLMGIDFGTKRIGVAISSEDGAFALPRTVLQNDSEAIQTLADMCAKENVGTIILGESRDFAGQKNPVMKKVEEFKEKLAKATNLPIEYELEFMTSREASHIQGEGKMLDASAAALILKSYIEKQK